ncbi:hypothetical protein [Streptomyces zaomyceticus]|uniref:hypothetical protein n=1 Tax=Streptomyces zaomyceticus TaxID=68286 RepID=UPI0036ADEC2D
MLATAMFLALGLFTPQGHAAPVAVAAPAGTSAGVSAGPDARANTASPPRAIPVPKSPDAISGTPRYRLSSQDGTEETPPAPAPSLKAGKQLSAAADPCGDLSGVIDSTGSALVQQLKALPQITCTYPLFNLTGENARKPSANRRW